MMIKACLTAICISLVVLINSCAYDVIWYGFSMRADLEFSAVLVITIASGAMVIYYIWSKLK